MRKDSNSASRMCNTIERYLRFCQLKNLAPGTIRNRRYILFLVRDFLIEKDSCENIEAGFESFVETYQTKWCGETLFQAVAIIKKCSRWAHANGLFDKDHANLLPYPKFDKLKQRAIPAFEDAMRVVCYRRDGAITKTAKTYDCIMHLLIRTGMRPGEACNLKVHNFDFSQEVISIPKTKTGQFRIVPIPPDIRNSIKEHLQKKDTNSYIFLSRQGNPLKSTTIDGEIYRRKRELGLGKIPLSSYTFRHLFATEMRRAGCPRSVLQKLLGHADPKSTMIYDHYNVEDLKLGLMLFHPLISKGIEPEKKIKILKDKVASLKLEEDPKIDITQEEKKGSYQLSVRW